jgi:hypothetical protein
MSALLEVVVSSRNLDTIKSVKIYNVRDLSRATTVHRCPLHRSKTLLPLRKEGDKLLCRCSKCDFVLVVR